MVPQIVLPEFLYWLNNTDLTTNYRIHLLRSVCFFVVVSALTIVNFKISCGILKYNWYNIKFFAIIAISLRTLR